MSDTATWEGAAAAPSAIGAAARSSAAAGYRISFGDVSVAYRGTTVLSAFSLEINPGEIVALLGPSGSGKTTALRAVAGFVTPSAGRVLIGDTDVTDLPPYAREIGMVVQNYALFPHMSVYENVAFGLRARGAERGLIEERVTGALAMVGMSDYRARYPRQLSGGQQQRVAIARALAIRPRVLLLDEPLSALDAQIRRAMVGEIARLHQELPELTVLYVTHDQAEALTLADRIAIMRDGRLAALGPARSLYRRPPNRFTATFLGRANLMAGKVTANGAGDGSIEIDVGGTRLRGVNEHGLAPGDEALLCVRPHDIRFDETPERPNRLTGTVELVDWQGDTETVTVSAGETTFRVGRQPSSESLKPGDAITGCFAVEDAIALPYEGEDG